MKRNLDNEEKTRNQGIDLLKVIGCILIVISHVVQSLDYVDINICSLATTNIKYLILSMLRYCGSLGNTIFFVCGAWFLLDSDKVNKRKIFQILMDIWVISIIILIIVYILRGGNIEIKMIIQQIFPTTFANNWYMTCYLVFYPLHPFLNIIIKNIEKETLLKIVLVMLFLYTGINYLQWGYFFTSRIILWITLYFSVAYMKLYLVEISNNIRMNVALFAVGLVSNIGMVIVTNILGLFISFFSDKLLHWNSICSPFIFIMAIGMLNIARNIYVKGKIINYISRLTFLIYIIHENMLLRTYYRPMIWQYVYENIGYAHILMETFVITVIVFVLALVLSIIYKCTISKCVTKPGDIIYSKICNAYSHIERTLLKLY